MFRQCLDQVLNQLRVQPSVFILGFQKCGTTSLFKYLIESKAYLGGYEKENDRLAFGEIHGFRKGYPIYFGSKTAICASHILGTSPNSNELLKRFYPEAKKIFILRDPIQRALSRFSHNKRKVASKIDLPFAQHLTFAQVAEIELQLIDPERRYSTIEISKLCSLFNPYGLTLGKGLYDLFIQDYGDDKNTHILFLEDLESSFDSEFARLMKFLGINSFSVPDPRIHNRASEQPKKPHLIDASLEARLIAFYSSSVRRLNDHYANTPASWSKYL